MMFNTCLIGLHALKAADRNSGMCKKEAEELFGPGTTVRQLSFTRREFITDKPAEQKGMSISGAQPKLSVRIDRSGSLIVTPENGEYILKPSPEAYPGLAANEHAIMLCMASLNFSIPKFGLIPFMPEREESPPELAFIIKRYDRENGIKIHQEQLDGAMEIADKYGYREGKQAISYERAAKFLIERVDSSLLAKYDIFDRVVCAYLLGNNDMHLRNIGVMHSAEGKLSLAPVYDFVSVVPYSSSFSEVLALPLLEKEESDAGIADGLDCAIGEYTGHDFLEFARGMGLNTHLAIKRVKRITNKLETFLQIIDHSYMIDEDKKRVCAYISRRATLLNLFDLSSL